jgi:hypothetical protein
MTKQFCLGLLALFLNNFPVVAHAVTCDGTVCGPLSIRLTSVSDEARYGLLVTSPADIACGSVQFVVTDVRRGVVGRTQALQPGQVQMVRIGQGYAAGDHALHITASGCPVHPAQVRRVRLGKTSPDHGWRAAAFVAAQFAP